MILEKVPNSDVERKANQLKRMTEFSGFDYCSAALTLRPSLCLQALEQESPSTGTVLVSLRSSTGGR